jgi:hypothetical protein
MEGGGRRIEGGGRRTEGGGWRAKAEGGGYAVIRTMVDLRDQGTSLTRYMDSPVVVVVVGPTAG